MTKIYIEYCRKFRILFKFQKNYLLISTKVRYLLIARFDLDVYFSTVL